MSGLVVRRKVPHLARPNLVARLFMLVIAKGTAQFALLVPSSATAAIVASGGMVAVVLIWSMVAAMLFGTIDVVVNDLCQVCEKQRGPQWLRRFGRWLRHQRPQLCFVIGACYLLQAYASFGGGMLGVGFAAWYYIEVAFISGMLFWGLRYLEAADADETPFP